MGKTHSRGVRFTVEQAEFLEDAYQKGSKIPSLEAKLLSERMGCKEDRIKQWFYGRRRKDENIPAQQRLTDEQREQLEKAYQKSSTPTKHALRQIAKKSDLSVAKIMNWFSRKRKVDHDSSNTPILDKEQSEYMVSIYATVKYPSARTLDKIAKKIGITPIQVYAWFSAKRATDSSILPKRKASPRAPSADLTTAATEVLEAAFAKNPLPTVMELKEIHKQTNIDEQRLERWFDRKRLITRRMTNNEKLKCINHHQSALEEAYQNNKYLSVKELDKMVDRIGMERKQVQSWFRNRRSRDKDFKTSNLYRRICHKFEAGQTRVLDETYQENKNLTTKEMYALADRIGLKQPQVYRWFSTKRSRDKDYKSLVPSYTAAQTQLLQAAYQQNSRPSTKEKEKLAKSVGLSLEQVMNWYYGARAKFDCPKIVIPLTTKQKDMLLDAYAQDSHPSGKKIAEIADCIGLTNVRVRNWFRHFRSPENQLKRANLLKAKQEESNLQGIDVKIKMEPMDVGLGDVK